ncbi:hypothetical protein [Streptomyces atratus]|uniref:hypothetical protein n=1 Tax=Streptomyces atratus TaxID=1893 RepID=UPI0037B1D9DA
MVLSTTRYIDAAVTQLRLERHEIRDEDVVRLSPLEQRNVNVLSRHTVIGSIPHEGLRPLRNPDASGLDDDDDGADED